MKSWRALVSVAFVLAVVGCSAAPPVSTPQPTTQGSSPVATQSTTSASTPPATAGGPPTDTGGTTPEPGGSTEPDQPTPLPEPTLTDPAEIAAGLFDPERVADGVVSLVAVMGVAVYNDAGVLLRPGSDQGAGDLSLTEGQVWGLIEMSQEDVEQLGDAGGPVPITNLYSAVQSSLPSDYTLDDLLAAYNEAYTAEPQSLAAQVMRGQQLRPDSGITRIQLWLLLSDAFMTPDASVGQSGSALAARTAAGGLLGIAARYGVPLLTSPVSAFSNVEWRFLLWLLPTMGDRVPFNIGGSGSAHEGHGASGPIQQFFARFGHPDDVEFGPGLTILRSAYPQDVTVTWEASPQMLDHGHFFGNLGQPVKTISGGTSIEYQVKQEAAAVRAHLANEYGHIGARADRGELVRKGYVWPESPAIDTAIHWLALGSRVARPDGKLLIEWHTEQSGWRVQIDWTDVYNGAKDTIRFDGVITEDSTAGGISSLSGTGTATGARTAWAACNPGIDEVPQGSGSATFIGSQTAADLTVGAFADVGTPLAGIVTGSFIFSNPTDPGPEHRSARLPIGQMVGDPCPHSIVGGGVATIRPLPK